jgi:ribosomal protein L37AE/L43A
MIKIPIVPLILVYFACILVLVGIWWLADVRRATRARRREGRATIPCRACGHVFIDRSSASLATCPHCGRPNERCD